MVSVQLHPEVSVEGRDPLLGVLRTCRSEQIPWKSCLSWSQGCGDCAVQWLLNSGSNLELQVLISLTQECESVIFSQEQRHLLPFLVPCPREAVKIKPLSRKRALSQPLKPREETGMSQITHGSSANLKGCNTHFFNLYSLVGAAQKHFLLFICTTGCLMKERTQPL